MNSDMISEPFFVKIFGRFKGLKSLFETDSV